MVCQNTNGTIIYDVFALHPDGREDHVGTFNASLTSCNAYLLSTPFMKHYVDGTFGGTYSYGIILAMFAQVYGFTVGLSGHSIRWANAYVDGVIYWRENTWRIKKLV